MSGGPLSMSEEYTIMFEDLNDTGAAFWKFFDMFRIQTENEGSAIKGVSFGKVGTWPAATDEQLKELKTYWKEQRKWIKKEGKTANPNECRRRMWFFMCRILEWGMFHINIRKEIYWWFDTCEERMTMKPQ
jgi:hypothetical protein